MAYLSIPHYRGKKEKYNKSIHGDGIFFTTDTHEIIHNNESYNKYISLYSWTINSTNNVLTLLMNNGEKFDITFDEVSETSRGLMSAEDKKRLDSLDIDKIIKTVDDATTRLNTLCDNRDKIVDGYWWHYNEETGEYENTGVVAKGSISYATFDIDPETSTLVMYTDPEYSGVSFELDEESGMLKVAL